jgi:hypothetical protein
VEGIAEDEFIAKEEAELFIWSNKLAGFKPVVDETVEARIVQTAQHTCKLAAEQRHA